MPLRATESCARSAPITSQGLCPRQPRELMGYQGQSPWLVVNLRILGMMKDLSFAALHQLLPLGVLGFGINAVTGMVFFIAEPVMYTQNVAFQWKVLLIVLAGVNVLYHTAFDEAWALGPGDDAPLTGKVIAARSSLDKVDTST
jgi:hypothetical protein